MSNMQTAADAHAAYQLWLDAGAQPPADVLAVIGISNPDDCPEAVMPGWLAGMVRWLTQRQDPAAAAHWGRDLYQQLARLGGRVPFGVILDWQASVVGPLAVEIGDWLHGDVAAFRALADMQGAALAGETFSPETWRAATEAAFVGAYGYAHRAGGEPTFYGVYAVTAARAFAAAYAARDPAAYAEAYLIANADTDADAYADAHIDIAAVAQAPAYAKTHRVTEAAAYDAIYGALVARLAAGMIACLTRAEPTARGAPG